MKKSPIPFLYYIFSLLTFLGIILPSQADPNYYYPQIQLGIDVLEHHRNFRGLVGKRVGLLSHAAAVNAQGKPTVDVFKDSSKVNLVAIFSPEHGYFSNHKADERVENAIDTDTAIPIYSLYGETRRPTEEMLSQIDVMVIDLQDIGVRSYTYVSCMYYTIEACLEQGVDVIVLDRPNPLGGLKVDGPPMDQQWISYVGAFSVPYVHGLTIGELAKMARDELGWLKKKATVKIIPMKGWTREMMWTDTGLPWRATSPNIPSLSAVLGYAMTGLGAQIGDFKHGIGTDYPFRLLSYPGKSAEELADALNQKMIPGLGFKVVNYKDKNGIIKSGVYTVVTDWSVVRPTELSFYMMQLSALWSDENPFKSTSSDERILFNKHVGSNAWWGAISNRGSDIRVARFIEQWEEKAKEFQQWSTKYWLYK